MKKNRVVALFLCAALLLSGFTNTMVKAAGATGKQTTTAQKSKWPSGPSKSSLSSDSAIVMELSTGTILYRKNIHKQHYPASITKIMTAMLTAENCSLDETVTFSKTAVYGIESGSSTIYTDVGEKLTVEQCLYAIMLESANEVCLGVAEQVSGTIGKFVDKMNERVRELGLKDTHFNNPNGLPDPKHYTTAYDMAVIAREAMKNPTFRKACSTKTYVMPKTNTHKQKRYWNNHHQMVNGYKNPEYEYKYCIGGKTGYTNVARNTLVTFAEKDGMELVCVIMKANGPKQGEPNEYTDSTRLLNFGFEKYKKHMINQQSTNLNKELFNNYDSYFDADASPIHLENESAVVLPNGVDISEATQKVTYDKNVTLHDGDNVIGHVTYTYNGRIVGSTDILYTKSADSTTSHLDEATRKIVDSKIQDIKESEKKDQKNANFLRKIKKGLMSFFGNRIVQIVLLVILIGIIITILVCTLKKVELPKFGRRRRGRISGGYRSRGGRRQHARRQRSMRSSERKTGKRQRRNHSKHYEKKNTSTPAASSKKKGVSFRKKRKNTKESFGKNFFDF